jgi:hypothetical protein
MQGNNIWSSQVNMFLSVLFVGSFALGAALILWQAFSGHNPMADVMYTAIQAETQTP